ncbi:phosphoribosyltransferase [Novosphingobium sp. PY1]|jgi:putative phosphoribosyl transferase|uniref:phosphoribosyltransferase n=1 Tax=Novosphingobium sp. PY1 TaxID=1882221 RepID=UPI000BE77946|nr:phosphoribosyltransferase [Novosphingobium sp. PY1]BBA74134.1 phosphoribosyltransferase [Novosphingobium sp. PY1]GFM31371.1 phosphoribosyltransferase [Novosphingobium sp. PY1]
MTGRSGFADREDAGVALAKAVSTLDLKDPVVLALPRGGVPVGFEVAKVLGAPLDILMVRKIGAPGHEEYGIGALVDGASPQIVIDEAMARLVGADRDYIDMQIARQLAEIERRRALYRTGPPVTLSGCTVILVDDGIATGGTVRAALKALAKAGPSQIILAVPLAPADVLPELREMCDMVICLSSPTPFHAVGQHYRNFDQTGDEEVIRLLVKAKAWEKPGLREASDI